ncbi:MAG: NAD(P)H-binding protein [Flavobacteriales bacterium]|nr:NAD(P)H-binding protein [Flavobacteriales bacterium]
MNIIVFGANGRAGLQCVKRALEKGLKVTAFVRDPGKIHLLHPNLTIVKGDALSQESVSNAVKGHDAVVSALSARDDMHRLAFIHHIINAMRIHHIKRVIAIGGIGALQASEHLKVYETATFPREYVEVTQAHIRVLDALLSSHLDFTFVCPPVIDDADRKGGFKTQDSYPTQSWNITSGDLADFIVGELEQKKFVGKKVGIGNE